MLWSCCAFSLSNPIAAKRSNGELPPVVCDALIEIALDLTRHAQQLSTNRANRGLTGCQISPGVRLIPRHRNGPVMTHPEFLSFNGRIVPYADAKVHVLTPGLKYAAGVFEGIRGYWNPRREEMYIFRLKEHLDRLQYSMRVMRYQHDLTSDAIEAAVLEVIRANDLREDVHIRPLVWIDGDGEMTATGPIGWMVAALPRPATRAVTDGIHCAVSSWQRITDNSMPARVKATANYSNSRLAGLQGKLDGYDNVLLLTADGHVSESPGSCFFMVRNGVVVTPSVTSSILESITRQTVIGLAEEIMQAPTIERTVNRTEVYAAEEAFFCGSGHEIQPILSLDRLDLGNGTPGPFTRRLQQRYFALVRGETNDHADWLTPVYGRA
jgi:branched-chain amino acid aminotransferase